MTPKKIEAGSDGGLPAGRPIIAAHRSGLDGEYKRNDLGGKCDYDRGGRSAAVAEKKKALPDERDENDDY
ncbi:hypothetical protein Q1695_015630 [Nippostrongylus brasiliensis]|nr:hypothetical protein Q1695_015630 [Nippostrongylus brasiliensis]